MDINFDEQAVIQELGIQNTDVVFQNQVVARIQELLSQQLMQRFQEQMTPEDYEKFAAVASDDNKARQWMAERFPSYQEWVADDLNQIVELMKHQVSSVLDAVHQQRQQ